MKECTRCMISKSLDCFGERKERPCGYRSICRQCSNDASRLNRKKNIESRRAYDRKNYAENKEKRRAAHNDWVRRNPEAMKAAKARCRQTPKGKIEANVRGHIHKAIRNGRNGKSGRKTFEILGYSPDALMWHLERQFTEGMSWENYGEWHIDHIIPLSAFNYSELFHVDFGRAWALENLRPLWAKENMSKGGKLEGEFQPCLQL